MLNPAFKNGIAGKVVAVGDLFSKLAALKEGLPLDEARHAASHGLPQRETTEKIRILNSLKKDEGLRDAFRQETGGSVGFWVGNDNNAYIQAEAEGKLRDLIEGRITRKDPDPMTARYVSHETALIAQAFKDCDDCRDKIPHLTPLF